MTELNTATPVIDDADNLQTSADLCSPDDLAVNSEGKRNIRRGIVYEIPEGVEITKERWRDHLSSVGYCYE